MTSIDDGRNADAVNIWNSYRRYLLFVEKLFNDVLRSGFDVDQGMAFAADQIGNLHEDQQQIPLATTALYVTFLKRGGDCRRCSRFEDLSIVLRASEAYRPAMLNRAIDCLRSDEQPLFLSDVESVRRAISIQPPTIIAGQTTNTPQQAPDQPLKS